jgi:predicted transcriptional regulator
MNRSLIDSVFQEDEEKIAAFSKALSHPVRIQILKILLSQPCCYTGNLTERIPLAQSTISQHLKTLQSSGLIQGEINPPKVKYCLNRANWILAKSAFESFFEEKTI